VPSGQRRVGGDGRGGVGVPFVPYGSASGVNHIWAGMRISYKANISKV